MEPEPLARGDVRNSKFANDCVVLKQSELLEYDVQVAGLLRGTIQH